MLLPPVEPGQYTSIRYANRLLDAGAIASIGSVGDSYDNALAESAIGLYKTERVQHEGPWRGVEDLELATLSRVHWFNETRLHGSIGHVPPIEYETEYYRQNTPRQQPLPGRTRPPLNPGRFSSEDQAYRGMDLLVEADAQAEVQEAVFFAVAELPSTQPIGGSRR